MLRIYRKPQVLIPICVIPTEDYRQNPWRRLKLVDGVTGGEGRQRHWRSTGINFVENNSSHIYDDVRSCMDAIDNGSQLNSCQSHGAGKENSNTYPSQISVHRNRKMTRRPLGNISSCVVNLSNSFALTNCPANIATTSEHKSKRMRSSQTICISDKDSNTRALEGISCCTMDSSSQSIFEHHAREGDYLSNLFSNKAQEISGQNAPVQTSTQTVSILNRATDDTNVDAQRLPNSTQDILLILLEG
ncbi:uncharacterized protein A4U43_C02F17090 [Asparagus officinalis]|uniref:Uncharacterized protein n=1 Tax=Asparagus officinalis TaxID=4686 RepID=A0A5P1FNQ4_ASPOF|nr:uncharacterized protein A4U43_C02F17090 [Asparagus officinalis]